MDFNSEELVKDRNGGKSSRIQKKSFRIHRGIEGTSGEAESMIGEEREERCEYQTVDLYCLGSDWEQVHQAALGS